MATIVCSECSLNFSHNLLTVLLPSNGASDQESGNILLWAN